jgi:hypothetical protein
MFIDAFIAIAFLILVFSLIAKTRTHEPVEEVAEIPPLPNTGSGPWMNLSERIFDPSDARWLRDELAFPKLAEALTLERKRLAICWLEALQASFDQVVRTRDATPSEVPGGASPESWQLLWLTIRFQFLVSYALFVVRLFGPYHRLIPSFSWLSLGRESERGFRGPAYASGRTLR